MEEPENKEEQEPVHTEQVQDIIGTPPIWLYRWGISLVLIIILLCMLVSSFIQYPEVVKTKLKIIFEEPLQTISLKDSARLRTILIENNQKIKKGQILAIAESEVGEITIKATNDGKLNYVGMIYENERLRPGQIIFNIATYNNNFYGEMPIPTYGENKVKPGQTVFVTFKNYQDEGQNVLQGKIKYIADNTFKNEGYVAKVDFPFDGKSNTHTSIILRNGMVADAQIVTVPSTIFHRITQSLMKRIK